MSDIDLIPTDYRHDRWLGRWSRKTLSAAGGLLVVALLAAGSLSFGGTELRKKAALLEKQRVISSQQRSRLEQLTAQKAALGEQLSMLRGLRSGAPAKKLFEVIDQALGDNDVWFVDWNFRRAGILVPEDQAQKVSTGYFIVVPEGQTAAVRQGWMVETHMMIRGRARDHSALSRFVENLFAQNPVVDVRVQKTALRESQRGVVDFDLAVVLNNEARI